MKISTYSHSTNLLVAFLAIILSTVNPAFVLLQILYIGYLWKATRDLAEANRAHQTALDAYTRVEELPAAELEIAASDLEHRSLQTLNPEELHLLTRLWVQRADYANAALAARQLLEYEELFFSRMQAFSVLHQVSLAQEDYPQALHYYQHLVGLGKDSTEYGAGEDGLDVLFYLRYQSGYYEVLRTDYAAPETFARLTLTNQLRFVEAMIAIDEYSLAKECLDTLYEDGTVVEEADGFETYRILRRYLTHVQISSMVN